MVNPTDCPDENGEYIEIYNATSDDIELFGLEITDNTASTSIITGVVIPSKGLVLGVKKPTSTHCYGNLPFDFQYRDIELGNVGDTLTLSNTLGTIDTVDFNGWTVPKGASLALKSGQRTHLDNDDEANWCVSGSSITDGLLTYNDYGTPNTTNLCASAKRHTPSHPKSASYRMLNYLKSWF